MKTDCPLRFPKSRKYSGQYKWEYNIHKCKIWAFPGQVNRTFRTIKIGYKFYPFEIQGDYNPLDNGTLHKINNNLEQRRNKFKSIEIMDSVL